MPVLLFSCALLMCVSMQHVCSLLILLLCLVKCVCAVYGRVVYACVCLRVCVHSNPLAHQLPRPWDLRDVCCGNQRGRDTAHLEQTGAHTTQLSATLRAWKQKVATRLSGILLLEPPLPPTCPHCSCNALSIHIYIHIYMYIYM